MPTNDLSQEHNMNNKVNNKTNNANNKAKKTSGIGFLFFYIFIILVFIIYSLYTINPELFFPKEEIDHKIYEIRSDKDFMNYSSITGSGGIDDPYILQNIKFDTRASNIRIEDTQAYFHIRNCEFIGGENPYIYIINSPNIRIYNNYFTDCDEGIKVQGYNARAYNISIYNNEFNNICNAISLFATYNTELINNTINNCNRGIYISILSHNSNKRNYISKNKILNTTTSINVHGGSYSYKGPENVLIEKNYISNTSKFEISNAEEVEIRDNIVLKGSYFKFQDIHHFNCINNSFEIIDRKTDELKIFEFDFCSSGNFKSNLISSERECIKFYQEINFINITNNVIVGDIGLNITQRSPPHYGAEFQNVTVSNNNFSCENNVIFNSTYVIGNPQFDNGSVGNYWNDYSGSDNNDDEIGDTPYIISPGINDNFPLMNPPRVD
jgi:nitrous oxidase accessory protein NosD